MTVENIVFIGASEFGEASLEKLASKYDVSGVITERDDPCADFAKQNGISSLRFEEGKSKKAKVKKFIYGIDPDMIVMCVWESKIPKSIVRDYRGKFINFHGSPLPAYRGWAPINWQIINGCKKIGMSVSLVTEQFDSGPLVSQGSFAIDDKVTASDVYDMMQPLAADMLLDTVDRINAFGEMKGEKQPQDEIYPGAPAPNEDNTRIDWGKTAKQVHNLVRGWYEMDYAYTNIDDEKLCITKTQVVSPSKKGENGEIVKYGKKSFEVSCARQNVVVYEARNEDGRRYNMPRLIGRLKKDRVLLG